MRDLDALLGSLVNIDRNSLIALLSWQANVAGQLARTARQRTAFQRAKRREAAERAARIERILSFLQHGEIGRDLCCVNLLTISCVFGANRNQSFAVL
jgi:hypothetical protein